MKRCKLVAVAVLIAAACPQTLSAQQSAKIWRIGVLEPTSITKNAANFDALRSGLHELGYVEGKDFIFEYRSSDGRNKRFRALAAELVRLKVDLILTRGTSAALAAKKATTTIPVVMAASGGPLRTGIVASLARPGGNITGLSAYTVELVSKRVGLLREIDPRIARIGMVHNMSNRSARRQWEELRSAAQKLGIEPQLFDIRSPEDIRRAFEETTARKTDALVLGNDSFLRVHRRTIAEQAIERGLPSAFAARPFVEAGGLISIATRYTDLYRRAAYYVDRILKGANPGDLPVEQPAKFEVVVNLKTAKALGIIIPRSVLLRADEVIE